MASIPAFLRNKYIISAIAFVAWMLFFDKDDIFMQRKRKNELRQIEQTKAILKQTIIEDRQFSEELKTNPQAIERFAREQYQMKRDNEDLFIIQAPPSIENQ